MDGIRCIPIIVAGGKGSRMGAQVKKQYLILDGLPVLVRTLKVFDHHAGLDPTILVVPEKDRAWCQKNLIQPRGFARPIHLVSGGGTRQESVLNGIRKAESLAGNPARTLVLIHDGVRPFVPRDLIDTLMETAVREGGCIPVLAVVDTLKQVGLDRRIQKTLSRDQVYQAQTPQVFRLDLISRAFEHARDSGFTGTDDSSVMEHAGFVVCAIPGSAVNIKLTTPYDLVLAHHILDLNGRPEAQSK